MNTRLTIDKFPLACLLCITLLTTIGTTSAGTAIEERHRAALVDQADAGEQSPGRQAGSHAKCELAWFSFISGGQTGVNGTVSALTVWSGDLIAGGSFTTAGGQTVNRIARWDGSAWQPFTSGGQTGVNGTVSALTVWNGDLIAGGFFTTAGGQTVNRIARWDGSAWQPFTSGGQIGTSGTVFSLAEWNGDLIAGGEFTQAGGQTVNRIARWDGTRWHPFESGGQTGVSVDGLVNSMAVWNGDLIAAGDFATAGGQMVNNIARWNGSQWHAFESGEQIGVNDSVEAVTVWSGDLIAGGVFITAGGQTVNRITRWNGAQWHPFTSGGQTGVTGLSSIFAPVFVLLEWNRDLVAGGFFTAAGGQTVNFIARWDGSAWQPFTSGGQTGFDSLVESLTIWNGELIAGGQFTTAGGRTVNNIARWDRCVVPGGACCINGIALSVPISESECLAIGGVFQGELADPGQATCPEPPPTCAGDLNNDGVVNVYDLLELLNNWGTCEEELPAEECGGPDAGSCFQDNGTPYCDDADCCEAVCACDPFCCENQWDSLCAGGGLNDNGCGAAVLCTP